MYELHSNLQLLQGHYSDALKKFMTNVYSKDTDEIVLKDTTEQNAIEICTRSDKFYFLRNKSFVLTAPLPRSMRNKS